MSPAATATKPPAAPAIDLKDVAKRIREQINYTNSVFYERHREVEAIFCTLLAAQHGIIYGPPGTAKTEMLEHICSLIDGAKFGAWLLDKQMDKAVLEGQYDIAKYDQSGVWERDIEDTVGDCHVQLWDEVGKVGPAVANTQLVLMQQRKVKPGKHWVKAPVLSIFGASNEFLDKDLAAFADRFLVWLQVDYLKEPSKFAALLQSAVFDPNSPALGACPTITLDELHAAIEHVKTIPAPSSIIDTILKLRTELSGHGIRPSDRRFKQSVRLLQASAFVNGRSVIDDDDLLILEHVLWNSPEEKDKVTRAVNSLASEFAKAAQKMLDSISEWESEIDARKDKSGQERAQHGGDIQYKMQETTVQLNKLIAKAKKQGRSVARLESVQDALQGLRLKVLVDCMGLDPDRARVRLAKDGGADTQGI